MTAGQSKPGLAHIEADPHLRRQAEPLTALLLGHPHRLPWAEATRRTHSSATPERCGRRLSKNWHKALPGYRACPATDMVGLSASSRFASTASRHRNDGPTRTQRGTRPAALKNPSGIQSNELDADDLLPLVRGHDVPDRHAVRWQVQLVRPGQRVILGERVGQRRNGFLKQVKDHSLDRPPHRLRKRLDLLPAIAGETDLAITH